MPAATPERRALIGLAHKAAVLAGLSDDERKTVQQAMLSYNEARMRAKYRREK